MKLYLKDCSLLLDFCEETEVKLALWTILKR